VNRSDLVFGMKQRNATGSAPTGFGAIELEKTEFGMTSDTTCVGAGLLPGGSETILVVEDEALFVKR
jgi:hypothetical protein